LRFRSCFRSAPGTRTRARDPIGFKLSVDVSRDFSLDPSPESSSKDSRKLFNPHLLSQTRTDVSVQFSRNRRRPAAGRRILAEALFSVKRKVKPRFTLPRLASRRQETSRNVKKRRQTPASAKEHAPRRQRGGSEHRPRSAPRQGDCTGSRAKNAQGLEESVGPGSNRAEGEVRAIPLPRTNRAPCAKKSHSKEPGRLGRRDSNC